MRSDAVVLAGFVVAALLAAAVPPAPPPALTGLLESAYAAPAGPAAGTTQPGPGVGAKKDELQNVRSQIERTRSKILKVKRKESGVLAELQKAEQDLERTRDRLDALRMQLAKVEKGVRKAESDLAEAETALDRAEHGLARYMGALQRKVRALYLVGADDYLAVLFTAEDFAELSTRLDLLRRMARRDADLFREVQAEKQAVEEQKAVLVERKEALEDRRADLKKVTAQVAAEEQVLAGKVSEREAFLVKIQGERKTYEEALDELEEMSRELEKVIRQLQARQSGQGKPPGSQPASAWGLVWPVSGRVSSGFGWRTHPIFRTRRFHSGIDIAAPAGSTVSAAQAGDVIYSGWIRGYGKTVILDHGGGVSTLYGHNSSLLVKEGTSVARSAPIARVGSTGFSTGPHLHFEVRREGVPTDPWQWLR